MKLSPATHQTYEIFFRQFFADDSLRLPASRVYAKRGASLVTRLLRVDGITLGRYIFIKPCLAEYISPDALKISRNLLAHELTHVVQYQKLGFFGFLSGYVREYFQGLRRRKRYSLKARREAYWEISHEIEARQAAAEFIAWSVKKETLPHRRPSEALKIVISGERDKS
jgi:hypothetical protein